MKCSLVCSGTGSSRQLTELYEEARDLAYDFDRLGRVHQALLKEIESTDHLHDKFVILDNAGTQDGEYFRRFADLLTAMRDGVQELIDDPEEFGQRYWRQQALGIIEAAMGDTTGKCRDYQFVFRMQDRTIPAGIRKAVRTRDMQAHQMRQPQET